MADQLLTVDSVEHNAARLRAEETDREHVALANADADGGQFGGDYPSYDKSAAVRFDDDGTTIGSPVSARALTFVDSGEVGWIGRGGYFRRTSDQRIDAQQK